MVTVFARRYKANKDDPQMSSFSFVWAVSGDEFNLVEKDLAYEIYTKVVSSIKEMEIKKKKSRERISWLIMFSEKLFKGTLDAAMWLIVVGAIGALGWFGYANAMSISEFFSTIGSFISNNIWYIGQGFLALVVIVMALIGFSSAHNSGKLNGFYEFVGKNLVVPQWLKTFSGWLGRPFFFLFSRLSLAAIAVCEFCSTFYEDNCPPITVKEFQSE